MTEGDKEIKVQRRGQQSATTGRSDLDRLRQQQTGKRHSGFGAIRQVSALSSGLMFNEKDLTAYQALSRHPINAPRKAFELLKSGCYMANEMLIQKPYSVSIFVFDFWRQLLKWPKGWLKWFVKLLH